MAPEDAGGAEDGPADPATGTSGGREPIRQGPAADQPAGFDASSGPDEPSDESESVAAEESGATADSGATAESVATAESSGTADSAATAAASTSTGSHASDDSTDASGRDVEVPMRVYKTVTVFSTLFAVVFVLAGFMLLDRATDRATASLSEVDPALAILGLLGIVVGAAVYAFGTRFRAEGMGTPKNRPDEPADDE